MMITKREENGNRDGAIVTVRLRRQDWLTGTVGEGSAGTMRHKLTNTQRAAAAKQARKHTTTATLTRIRRRGMCASQSVVHPFSLFHLLLLLPLLLLLLLLLLQLQLQLPHLLFEINRYWRDGRKGRSGSDAGLLQRAVLNESAAKPREKRKRKKNKATLRFLARTPTPSQPSSSRSSRIMPMDRERKKQKRRGSRPVEQRIDVKQRAGQHTRSGIGDDRQTWHSLDTFSPLARSAHNRTNRGAAPSCMKAPHQCLAQIPSIIHSYILKPTLSHCHLPLLQCGRAATVASSSCPLCEVSEEIHRIPHRASEVENEPPTCSPLQMQCPQSREHILLRSESAATQR